MDYDFKSAVGWLDRNFSNSAISSHANHSDLRKWREREKGAKTLKLPPKEQRRLPQVIQYLTHRRCIPETVVQYLVRQGVLYADNKSNAVFLMLGKERRVVGAEIRGTSERWRKWHAMAVGSKKHLGCFYIRAGEAKTVVLCESAIDAISYFVLHPHCIAISTAGATVKIPWLNQWNEKGYEVFCAFDADDTGELMANRIIKAFPAVKRIRPQRHDWNDVLQHRGDDYLL
jgi:5S rRNA maturation endonuclease (ribonuclease M5)